MKSSDPKSLLCSACSYLAMNGLVKLLLEASPTSPYVAVVVAAAAAAAAMNASPLDKEDDGSLWNITDPEMILKATSRRSEIM